MTSLSAKHLIAILVLTSISSNAYASDFSGLFSALYLFVVVSISSAINIGFIISYHVAGKYQDLAFARKHVGFAMIIPAIGVLIAMGDHRTEQDMMYMIAFNALAGLIALSPLFIRNKVSYNTETSGKTMFIVSLVFGLIGASFFAPMTIAAIIAGHMAMSNTKGTLYQASVAVLALCYGSLLVWIYFMWAAFL